MNTDCRAPQRRYLLAYYCRRAFWIALAVYGLTSCNGSHDPESVTCLLPQNSQQNWSMRFEGFELDCTRVDSFEGAKYAGPVTTIEIREASNSGRMDFVGFDKLQRLMIADTDVTGLNLSGNAQLSYLTLDTPALSELDLPGNSFDNITFKNLDSLEDVELGDVKTRQFHVVGDLRFDLTSFFENNQINGLSVNYSTVERHWDTVVAHVAGLTLRNVTEDVLDLSSAADLVHLTIIGTHREREALQVVATEKLKLLSIIDSLFGEVDLSGTPGLLELEMHDTDASVVDTSNLSQLRSLMISGGSDIDGLNLANNVSLADVWIAGTDLHELDLSMVSADHVEVVLHSTPITLVRLPASEVNAWGGLIRINDHQSEALAFEGGGHFRNFTFENNGGRTRELNVSSLYSISYLVLSDVDIAVFDISQMNSLSTIYINQSTIEQIALPTFFNRDTHSIENGGFVCKDRTAWPANAVGDLEEFASAILCSPS